ncbi:MAG TPA: FUSC family membrane protein [Chitinophagaceae bacterium]|nr:FUSC family membrane protein [Chitinophagaceae bacterium]
MDYKQELQKFISSQYLYAGLRITAGVIIPALVLNQYGLLPTMMGIPLGVLFVSLADSPGPISNRRNAMMTSIAFNFMAVVVAGYSSVSPFMICMEIIVFGMFFSLIAVYGNRANSIGLMALIVFILNIDRTHHSTPLLQGMYITIGGAWYALLSLTLNTLRPYRPIQQLLGECIMETAAYLRTRSLFYSKTRDEENIFKELMQHQVNIHNHHDALREMLFTTRRILSESTRKGRVLMMSFLDSIDLLERIMTSQQDYTLMHMEFDETGILDELKDNITVLANELHHIGLAIQGGYAYKSASDLDNRLQQSMEAFAALRKTYLKADNIEGFISLRHILYSLEDITGRIKRLQAYTTYDSRISKQYTSDVEVEKFVAPQEFDINLLTDNLSLQSGTFRHAVRLTAALLAGYIVSLLFPLGHGYWILLTIAVIMKPAYSITRRRNVQRLTGTFIGAAVGFIILLLVKNNTALFFIMLVTMVTSYSLLKLEYTASSAALTVAVLLMFYFVTPSDLNSILIDRMIDTAIGSALAYIVSTFVLPAWEYEQIEQFIRKAIEANRHYFLTVAQSFTGAAADVTSFKMARKEAFVALANLSDIFQRMLSEPSSQRPHLPQYHQFVTTSHTLTSHIASLSYYAARFGSTYAQEAFRPMVNEVSRRFNLALAAMDNVNGQPSDTGRLPIHKKVQQLLAQRKKDITEGIESDVQTVRRTLSDLKTITDQFQLIHATLADQAKVLNKIKND